MFERPSVAHYHCTYTKRKKNLRSGTFVRLSTCDHELPQMQSNYTHNMRLSETLAKVHERLSAKLNSMPRPTSGTLPTFDHPLHLEVEPAASVVEAVIGVANLDTSVGREIAFRAEIAKLTRTVHELQDENELLRDRIVELESHSSPQSMPFPRDRLIEEIAYMQVEVEELRAAFSIDLNGEPAALSHRTESS